jgi:hypothetical protein
MTSTQIHAKWFFNKYFLNKNKINNNKNPPNKPQLSNQMIVLSVTKKKNGLENYLGSCIWQEKNSSKMQRFSKSNGKVS